MFLKNAKNTILSANWTPIVKTIDTKYEFDEICEHDTNCTLLLECCKKGRQSSSANTLTLSFEQSKYIGIDDALSKGAVKVTKETIANCETSIIRTL